MEFYSPNQIPDKNFSDISLPPITVLLFVVLLIIFSLFLGLGLLQLLGTVFDLDWQETMTGLNEESLPQERNFVRLGILVNHLTTFVLPAIGAAIFFARKHWVQFLGFRIRPFSRTFANGALGSLLLIFSFPLVQFFFYYNKQIPLPEWMKSVEDTTNSFISNLMITDSPTELWLNILVIALLPALGEEMIFRGILQKSLQNRISKHLAIWIAALIFSAFHMQFEGFLPRLFLGAVLGYLFYWSGTLWVPILAHFLNNALQIVAVYLYQDQFSQLDINQIDQPPLGPALLSCILLLAIAYTMMRYNGIVTRSPNPDLPNNTPTNSEKL